LALDHLDLIYGVRNQRSAGWWIVCTLRTERTLTIVKK
jgi:hypothetical protein